MKIAILSRNKEKLQKHLGTIRKYKNYISDKPNVIVAVGGDGTFLAAERSFPGIPKLMVREQSICVKCDWDNLGEGIKRIIDGRFKIEKFSKINARLNGRSLDAVNDIVLRNEHPMHAIRFLVRVNGKRINKEFIGDGLVVSTAFGSEGYFRSITGKHFEKGLGIAFNNITKKHAPLVLGEDARIEVKLTRGTALIAADNHDEVFRLAEGRRIVIKKSKGVARLVRLSG